MKKAVCFWVIAVLLFSIGSTNALAKGKGAGGGQGHKQSGDHPSGWEKGEKKGWGESEVPPGWEKGEKKGWDGEGAPPGLTNKNEVISTEKGHGKGKKKEKHEDKKKH